LRAYASEVITVNAEAKGFTLSKIIPGDAATKGVAIEALVSVEDNSIRACFDGTTADATHCHAVGKDRDFTITGAANLQQFSMYQGSGQATIHVTYFRQAGK
jgi:hypothetical protein